ncbi:MAG: TVP38/TMEM64 family protein, partial [Opitutaceae bacterium]
VVRLAVAGVLLAAVGILVLREIGMQRLVAWFDLFVTTIRNLGPWVFFAAMTVLPAVGAPLMAFNLVAGEAFASRMTMPGVIVTVALTIAANLALTYWLARYALRPLLTRVVTRYGYSVPRVTKDNALTVTLLVRLTPGPPFFLQGYLLGLAEVPLRLFMVVSWLAVLPIALSAVVLGKAAREGNIGKIAVVLGVMVVAVVAVQLVRRKFASRATGGPNPKDENAGAADLRAD